MKIFSVSLHRRCMFVSISNRKIKVGGGGGRYSRNTLYSFWFFFSNVGTPVSVSRRDGVARSRVISGISDLAFSSTATIVYRRFRTVLFRTPSGFFLLFIRLAIETSVFIAVVSATIDEDWGGGGSRSQQGF